MATAARDLITGAGPGGGPHVRIFSGVDLSELDSFFVGTSASGVTVGSIGDAVGLRFTSASTDRVDRRQCRHVHGHDGGQPTPAITRHRRAARRRDVRRQRRRHRHARRHARRGHRRRLCARRSPPATAWPTDRDQTFTLTVNQAPAITSAQRRRSRSARPARSQSPPPASRADHHRARCDAARRRDVRGQRRRHRHVERHARRPAPPAPTR